MGRKTRLASRVVFACVVSTWLLALAVTAPAPARLVAIADVHGAYPEFVAILQRTGLIDENRRWAGGSATLVQLGDMIDRGARSRECLDLLMALEGQAEKAGGKVIPLLGNHEAMNIMGDMRYVTPEIYRTFATDQSEKLREQAYKDYMKFVALHREHTHTAVPADDEAGRQKWMGEHPTGFFEYRDAFGPDGKYGRWIRKHHAIVQIGEGLFVHGGLSPELKFRNVTDLDDQVHAELPAFDSIWRTLSDDKIIWPYMTLAEAVQYAAEESKWIQSRGAADDAAVAQEQEIQKLLGYRSWMSVSSDGPLWYRGLAQDPEEKLMSGLTAMLARLKAQYIVEGHTVMSKSEITPRFDNHVFLLDTGMLKEEYQGRASALEIKEGKFTAYYADGEPKVLVAPGSIKTALVVTPETSGSSKWR